MSEGTSFNPAKRRLCPDGACIGVIGDDGRCRVCGTSASGAGAARRTDNESSGGADSGDEDGDMLPVSHDGDDSDDSAGAYAAGDGSSGALDAAGDGSPNESVTGGGFRPDRRLCDDGSCIGLIGPDGVCGVCGRQAGS